MILRIVVLLIASVGAATTLKQNLCIIPMATSFSKKEQRQNGDEVYGVDAVFVVGFGKKY